MKMKEGKFYHVTIMLGLLLILSFNLMGVAQAAPVSRAGSPQWPTTNLEITPPPRSLTGEPGLILPLSLPPQIPLYTPAITVTKIAIPDPVNAGEQLTYEITVESGDEALTGVVISDTLDTPEVIFDTASDGGTHSAGVVTWDVGAILTNSSILRTLVVTVTDVASGTVLNNLVEASSAEGVFDSETITTTVETEADLEITKSDSPGTVIAGETLTYTLNVVNHGPSVAESVTVSDTLPSGMSLASVNPSGSCSGTTIITCNLGDMAKDEAEIITIVVTVGGSVRGTINNTAEVTSSTSDPTPGNNSDPEGTSVTGQADLTLTKDDDPDPVQVAFSPLDYTLTITNNGPSDATGVVVTDTLPSGMTFAFSTPSICTGSSQVVCTLTSSIPDGGVFQVTIRVNATAIGKFTNSAVVDALETDPNTADNTATEETTVNPADLTISKSASSATVLLGRPLTYTITIYNNGPNTATSVLLTDTLPSSVSFQSSSPGSPTCTHASGKVTCNLGNISPLDDQTVTIVVIPTLVGTITNTVQTAATQPDPDTTDNTATVTTVVNPLIDLVVSKSTSSSVVAGKFLTYTLSITNNGPSTATGVTLTDSLSPQVTFFSASAGCTHLAGVVTCALSNLADDANTSVTIVVKVNSSATGPIANSASVTGAQFDSNLSNNTSNTVNTTVTRQTDLTIKKSAPSSVVAGNNLTFTLTITNNGSSDAIGSGVITVTDTLPVAQVSFVSASSGCSLAGSVVTCILGNLVSGGNTSVNIVVKVNSSATGLISNNASVSSLYTDTVPGNNTSNTTSTTINGLADLSLAKVGSPDAVLPDQNITYNLTVTNNGPSDASGVTLTDNLPSNVSFVSASPVCSLGGSTVTCSLPGNLASGANSSVSIVVKVNSSATGTVVNPASVTSSVTDLNSTNNSASDSTLIGEFEKMYIPILVKPALTELSIFNDDTGGNVTFTVIGTGVECTVSNGDTEFCGEFPPGTYNVKVASVCGPTATFSKTYGSGPVTTRVFCQ